MIFIAVINNKTPRAIINVIIAPMPIVAIISVKAVTNTPAKNAKAIATTSNIKHKQEQSFLFSFLQYISTFGSIT